MPQRGAFGSEASRPRKWCSTWVRLEAAGRYVCGDGFLMPGTHTYSCFEANHCLIFTCGISFIGTWRFQSKSNQVHSILRPLWPYFARQLWKRVGLNLVLPKHQYIPLTSQKLVKISTLYFWLDFPVESPSPVASVLACRSGADWLGWRFN